MATNKRPSKHGATRTSSRPTQKARAKSVQVQKYSAPPFDLSSTPQSYEEAVIRNIMSSKTVDGQVPDEAVVLSATLSSLTGGMKDLHYKSGMQVGKALYNMRSQSKTYLFPEEYVGDIVSFFESAGYKNITYTAIPEKTQIEIHDNKGPRLGTSIHAFEAGIISGFLSAANRKYVPVTESACSNSSGSSCKFVTGGESGYDYRDTSTIEAMGRLAEHIATRARQQAAVKQAVQPAAGLSNAYYQLSSALLFDKRYTDQVKEIATYMGMNIGEHLSASSGKKSASLERTIRMLNLGNTELKSTKPFHLKIWFDKITARKEFIDLSLAFINGLIAKRLNGPAVATERSLKNSYVIDIREGKPQGAF